MRRRLLLIVPVAVVFMVGIGAALILRHSTIPVAASTAQVSPRNVFT
jgi:hypothetical protein